MVSYREYFYQFGEIRSVTIAQSKSCGFVCYTTREAAEKAAERTFNKAIIKGKRMKILWGKSQEERAVASEKDKGPVLQPVPGLPKGNVRLTLFWGLMQVWWDLGVASIFNLTL